MAGKYDAEISVRKVQKLSYSKILGSMRHYKRSAITLKEDDTTLRIVITANDLTALRAAVNSILRDLQVIEASKAGI